MTVELSERGHIVDQISDKVFSDNDLDEFLSPDEQKGLRAPFLVPPEAFASFERPDGTAPACLDTEGNNSTSRPQPRAVQQFLIDRRLLVRDSLVDKFWEAGLHELSRKLANCASQKWLKECLDCGKTKLVTNHCDNRFCPICQPRLAKLRQADVEFWAGAAKQPKHIVLTVRNSERLSKSYLQLLKRRFNRLLRQKFCATWRGGFCAMEITNRGNGWHAHFHCLVDAPFIDQVNLAKIWAKLNNQAEASIRVQAARGDFIKEICKYVVKGNQMTRWTPNEIAEFVAALDGVRTCWTFGNLFRRKNAEWREAVKASRKLRAKCECGSCRFRFTDPNLAAWRECEFDQLGANFNRTGPPVSSGDSMQTRLSLN